MVNWQGRNFPLSIKEKTRMRGGALKQLISGFQQNIFKYWSWVLKIFRKRIFPIICDCYYLFNFGYRLCESFPFLFYSYGLAPIRSDNRVSALTLLNLLVTALHGTDFSVQSEPVTSLSQDKESAHRTSLIKIAIVKLEKKYKIHEKRENKSLLHWVYLH